jgi:Ca-activated chloride channel family protein
MLSELWDYLDPGFFAPIWLLVGVVAMGALVLLEIRAWFRRRRALESFAASHLVAALAGSVSPVKRLFKALLIVLATGLLCLALARPHLLFDWSDETRSGLDVLLAVDCSKSMLTEDVRPDRLERAKLAIDDFADHLPENRLGLIAFAGDAFLQCPLTLDHEAFLDSVRLLDTDSIPKPGTDIATAIDEAVDALRSQPNNMKFLILITDGEDLEGRAIAAAKNAAQNGLRIFTVGVGTSAGDRIPERDEAGQVGYHHDVSGAEVVSRLDEGTLRQIAEITGGAYAPLGQDGEGLDQIYDRYIAPLPKQNLEEKRQKIHIERFEWPLALAIFLLMGEFMITDRARPPAATVVDSSRPPVRRRRARTEVAASAVAPVAWLVLAASPVQAADVAQAERDYQSGDFEQSMQGYQKAAESDPARPKLQFNRGDAAYKAGEFSEAEEAYHLALETPDLDLQEQSYYNLGNTQYEHGAAMEKVSSRKTVKLWEAALRSYECALKLKDSADTKHNYALVKKKLEELKLQRSQRGKKGSSNSGQGQSGDGSQPQQGKNPQSGPQDSDDDSDDDGDEPKDQGNQPGQPKDNASAKGGKDGQQQADAATNLPMRAYSGTRSQDLKDPGIKSRQDAQNLLDSLKDDEHHVTARAVSGNGQDAPPPSGKDW